jgi:hypothetical protein
MRVTAQFPQLRCEVDDSPGPRRLFRWVPSPARIVISPMRFQHLTASKISLASVLTNRYPALFKRAHP